MHEPWVPAEPEAVNREKARSRELRASQWWKRRIADGRCHYCRRGVGHRALTMDHIVPLARGGRGVRGNVVPACPDCNARKKWMVPVEWQEYLDQLARERGE